MQEVHGLRKFSVAKDFGLSTGACYHVVMHHHMMKLKTSFDLQLMWYCGAVGVWQWLWLVEYVAAEVTTCTCTHACMCICRLANQLAISGDQAPSWVSPVHRLENGLYKLGQYHV